LADAFILVVASTNAKAMDFFDTSTGERLGRITGLAPTPHEIWADQSRRLVYMTSTYRSGLYGSTDRSHEISVIDVDARALIDVIDVSPFLAPHDIEYCPVNDLLYTSVEPNPAGDNGIVIIEPKDRRIVGNIPTEAPNCHWITLTPDGSRCYVAHKEAPLLSVIDLEKQTVLDTIALDGGAEEIAVSPDGRWVYVNTPAMTSAPPKSDGERVTVENIDGAMERSVRQARVVKIDTETNSIVASAGLEPYNSALHVLSDGKVLVSQLIRYGDSFTDPQRLRNGTVSLLDGDSLAVLARAEAGLLPFTSRSTPDASAAYVANLGSGTVSVLDVPSLAIRDTLISTPPVGPAPGGSHGLALLPR
jgi:DNA-binding beta-propeller fold protein YncE